MAKYQLYLSDRFDFGKYKGEKVIDVLHKDPSYILEFGIKKIEDFFIYDLKEYIEKLKEESKNPENLKITETDNGFIIPDKLLKTMLLYKYWDEERLQINEDNKENFLSRNN